MVVKNRCVSAASLAYRYLDVQMGHGFQMTRHAKWADINQRKPGEARQRHHLLLGCGNVSGNECRDQMSGTIMLLAGMTSAKIVLKALMTWAPGNRRTSSSAAEFSCPSSMGDQSAGCAASRGRVRTLALW